MTTIAPELAKLATPVGELRPFARNPRRGDVAAIAASLEAHGQYRPIVARLDGEVLAGNHTLAAAIELGWTHVAAVKLDVDDERARRIVLADNRTAELAGYDNVILAELLTELNESDAGLGAIGYDPADLAGLLASLEASNRSWADRPVRELPENPISRRGQRWRLGPHTLVCGDSQDAASWLGCPDGGMLLTDPPYGIGYDGGASYRRDAIEGDATGFEAAELVGRVLDVLPLTPGAPAYVFCASGADGVLVQHELVQRGLMRWALVWVKDQATFGRSDYQQQHETIAYGWQSGAPRAPVTDRKHTTVLTFPRPRDARVHPTMKPVDLLAALIAAHGLPAGSLILEPFAGSGSTVVAAHQEGLTCWAVEWEPAYCDVILDRWRDGTGIEPVEVE